MGIFDDAFRKVFSDKKIFVEFINSFVPNIGISKIKEKDVSLENPIYKDPYFSNREADLPYRINYNGKDLYVYLLIEHQSRVDYLMAFRVLGYMVRIWEYHTKKYPDEIHKKSFKLPPIIPIVFYDGKEKWTATQFFNEKIYEWERFKKFIPTFTYELIDINKISIRRLREIRNAVSIILRLDSAKKEDALKIVKELTNIINLLPKKEQDLLKKHISAYIMVLAHRTGMSFVPEEIGDRGEVTQLFERFEESLREYIEEEKKKAIQRGLQEGIKKGIQEGIEKGMEKGIKKGIEKGLRKGLISGIKLALEVKFEEEGIEVLDPYLENLETEKLKRLRGVIKKAKSIKEVVKGIEKLKN